MPSQVRPGTWRRPPRSSGLGGRSSLGLAVAVGWPRVRPSCRGGRQVESVAGDPLGPTRRHRFALGAPPGRGRAVLPGGSASRGGRLPVVVEAGRLPLVAVLAGVGSGTRLPRDSPSDSVAHRPLLRRFGWPSASRGAANRTFCNTPMDTCAGRLWVGDQARCRRHFTVTAFPIGGYAAIPHVGAAGSCRKQLLTSGNSASGDRPRPDRGGPLSANSSASRATQSGFEPQRGTGRPLGLAFTSA